MIEKFKANYKALTIFLTILTGLIFIVFLTSPLVFKLIINPLGLSKISKLNSFKIFHNYLIMINYLLNPFVKELKFSDFRQSISGVRHFAEVKNLLLINDFTLLVGFFLSIFIFRNLKQANSFLNIKRPFKFLSFIPWILVILFTLFDFHNFFNEFHLILFRNSDWIFDPIKDPIIEVLPEEFFQVEFIIFFSLWVLTLFLFNSLINYQLKKELSLDNSVDVTIIR